MPVLKGKKLLPIYITAGFLLDLIFGDPYSFPHPVKLIGKIITWLEKIFIKIKYQKVSGILFALLIVTITYGVVFNISSIIFIFEIFFIYTLFCMKSLATEAKKIYLSLEKDEIEKAKADLKYLVSRDTEDMNETEIIKSTIETISENVVDGIISPMFYIFLGGAPLAYAFKAVSTLDSMVGYKTEKYINFGWASAKLDDLLNYIPARITGFIIIPIAALVINKRIKETLRMVIKDRDKHSSPNSAHSEAAFAGAIGCQLGGPAKYFGETIEKPAIGDYEKNIETKDILTSIKLMYATSIIGLIIGCAAYFIFRSSLI